MDWLLEPWSFAFMRWALVACLVLGGIHAYLGHHVVRRGVLFVDLAMAHMAALGAAVGVVFGYEHGTFLGHVVSLAFALMAATIFAIVRSTRIHQEALIAIVYALSAAATFVVLERSPHGMEEVRHLLIGQILTVPPGDVLGVAALYGVIGLAHARMHPITRAVSLGREVAHPRLAELFFYGTFALVVTSSVSLVGVLLVFSLLVIPAVTGVLLASHERGRLAVGWSAAGLAGVVGLHLAFHGDFPAGPVIVLVLGAFVLLAALWTRRPRPPAAGEPDAAAPVL